MSRAYTYDEIEGMRRALIDQIWMAESRPDLSQAKLEAEYQLRTYLLAGIDPSEIINRPNWKGVGATAASVAKWKREHP